MSSTESNPPSDQTKSESDRSTIGPEIASTIRDLSVSDLVVINDDTRTWEVVCTIEDDLEDSPEDQKARRVIRLQNSSGPDGESVFSLVLDTYSDHYEGEIEVLETKFWYEEGQTHAIDSIQLLKESFSWVVLKRNTETYHLPDPLTAGHGEATPACGSDRTHNSDRYRFARKSAIRSTKRPCKDCLRRHQPRAVSTVSCPDCGCSIASGIVQGVNANAIDGIEITCPNRKCKFQGVVSLEND